MTYGISEAANSDGIRSKERSDLRLERDHTPSARNRRMVRWVVFQADVQEIPQRNESAARLAMPRSESMPSKYPTNSSRK